MEKFELYSIVIKDVHTLHAPMSVRCHSARHFTAIFITDNKTHTGYHNNAQRSVHKSVLVAQVFAGLERDNELTDKTSK